MRSPTLLTSSQMPSSHTPLSWALDRGVKCISDLLDHDASLNDVREDLQHHITPAMRAYPEKVRLCRRAMWTLLLVMQRSGVRWDPRLRKYVLLTYVWSRRAEWTTAQ